MTIELAQPDAPTINGTWFVTFYPDKGGKWRWRLKAPNGKIFAVSGESFASKANAQRAANRLAHLLSQDMQVSFGERRGRPAGSTTAGRKFPIAFDKHVLAARAKWGRASPFRLGLAVGFSGEDLPNPYDAGTVGHKHYKRGLEHAQVQAAREKTGEKA